MSIITVHSKLTLDEAEAGRGDLIAAQVGVDRRCSCLLLWDTMVAPLWCLTGDAVAVGGGYYLLIVRRGASIEPINAIFSSLLRDVKYETIFHTYSRPFLILTVRSTGMKYVRATGIHTYVQPVLESIRLYDHRTIEK